MTRSFPSLWEFAMRLSSACCLLSIGLCWQVGKTSAAEAPKPLKVCILSGCNTYNSEESLPPFQEFLEQNYNVKCVRVIRKATDDLPGLEQLDDCDVAF